MRPTQLVNNYTVLCMEELSLLEEGIFGDIFKSVKLTKVLDWQRVLKKLRNSILKVGIRN